MNLFERHAHVNQLFQQSPVEAAYLSGSLATRATFGEMTDVDIAILLADQIATDHFLDYQCYFLSELTKRLESDALDVVILNQASLLLKLQVVKYGQILYSRDEKKRTAFESRAVMDYLDFRQMDDLQNQALSRRLRTPTLALDRSGLRVALNRLDQAQMHLGEAVSLPLTVEEFTADLQRQAIVERYALLSIEALAHTVTLLYAGLGITQPESYADLLTPLVKRGIVPLVLTGRLNILLRQRDVLMRTPDLLSRAQLLELARSTFPDLAELRATIAALIGSDDTGPHPI